MIIVALLAILAAIVMPMYSSSGEVARAETMCTNLQAIRGAIVTHSGTGDVPLSTAGFPLSIDPHWFRAGKLPDHAWTGSPIVLDTVADAASVIYPTTKTFDPSVATDSNAWYNSTNGAFCVRVPVKPTAGLTLELFGTINGCHVGMLNQVTE